MLDFNSAENQGDLPRKIDKEAIRAQLLNSVEDALFYLFPKGHVNNHHFHVGSTKGEAGKSLVVDLKGENQGKWFDFAENEGGDIFNLWERARGFSKSEFGSVLMDIGDWIGNPSYVQKNRSSDFNSQKDLGKPTAKWDYLDKQGKLIACVYRYDTEGGKEFRVWDVKNRKAKSPNPRPLYNIIGIVSAKKVILVEGEKSADRLIEKGFTATTAMFGANAPINKTDWSPLFGKEVVIWPDNDSAGIDYGKKVSAHLSGIASFISILTPPKDKPVKWDAADAVLENFDIAKFLESAQSSEIKIPRNSLEEFRNDKRPMPDDIIAPRLLTPSGMLLIGGAPKVGKSDFLINFLTHMAAGESFLGLKPPHPLKIFYLQTEIGYFYLRERIEKLKISDETFLKASRNLIITSQLHMILNDEGIAALQKAILQDFPDGGPDIICIDPIRNVFDGGENSSENDNSSMLFFLQNRVEKLRALVNSNSGIILCHHTKKIRKKDVEEDPFQALSGAGSLRSFYSSGLLLHRPNEYEAKIHLHFELRNGNAISKKIVEKIDNKWTELNLFSERLVRKDYGNRLDAERDRKSDVIIKLIKSEATAGRVYTANQFAEKFENKCGLGYIDSIGRRISILATKGYIKYSRDFAKFKLQASTSKFGIVCVEGMEFPFGDDVPQEVLPTHFKCPNTGNTMEITDDQVIWSYEDEERGEEKE